MDSELLQAAHEAREKAFAPYSKFLVGAALRTKDGVIVKGCNIEVASYSLTLCAERVAIFKAVSDGLREFEAIAVVVDTERLTPPCGACRQVIWEFCGDISVTMQNLQGVTKTMRMSELLPDAFDGTFLA